MSRDYTSEFKDQAIKLVTEKGYNPSKASRELGIPDQTLLQWLKKSGWKRKPVQPQLPASCLSEDPRVLQIQVRELQAQIKRLEMEKEILKKATVYFASQNP
jgi:transposase